MKILVLTEEKATQAKLILKSQMAIVKVPGNIPVEQQYEIRNKLLKVADLNRNNTQFLKLYYKVGTPYMFLNKKLSSNKKETAAVYTYADL